MPESAPVAKVLVVEDSMPLRRMLARLLLRLNVEAVEAGHGEEAAKILQEQGVTSFALILCDLMMPVQDGATFIAAAKQTYGKDLPPVVICSSRSDRAAVEAVRTLGVQGYILKPFKTETILNKVGELLKIRTEPAGEA